MAKNEPIRLQKLLSQCGIASRRKAEQMIIDGHVKVNGKTAQLGDKDSEGMLILTNDGELANKIMHPKNSVYKIYRVTVRPSIDEDQLVKLETGIELDGVKTAPAMVHVLHQEPGRVVLEMILHEGKNREIRRMCEAVGLEVARLKRIQIGGVKMGMLKQGDWRDLTENEVKKLLSNPFVNGKQLV